MAVHKLAHSLDTELCLVAVSGFITKYGYSNTVFIDNGRNFVRAAESVKALMYEWHQVKIQKIFSSEKNWKFNFSTFLRRVWSNSSASSTETFKSWFQCKTSNTFDSKTSSRTTTIGESSSWSVLKKKLQQEYWIIELKMRWVKSSQDVSNTHRETPMEFNHRWQIYSENDSMNMFSELPIPDWTTSDHLKLNYCDVSWRDGTLSSLAKQTEQYTSKL